MFDKTKTKIAQTWLESNKQLIFAFVGGLAVGYVLRGFGRTDVRVVVVK